MDEFVLELSQNAPAAAQVTELEMHEVPIEPYDTFEIRFSEDKTGETTFVSPDLATCDQCVEELFNEKNRRFRYPFINCTNCGPRFTIIEHLPYDRPSTSMKKFSMCEACKQEYTTPTNRRFHAQPNACFECGPHISWSKDAGANVSWGLTRAESDEIFSQAVELLRAGKILAVKGLGGFHLVCDANNVQAVARLRERKHRFGKAFAIMVANVQAASALCDVSDEEASVLSGSVRPIVLLRKASHTPQMPGVADGLLELGIMLPYTPVQHILMHDFAQAEGGSCACVPALVMTSGNIHDEPICIGDAEAYEKLSDIADAFLGNDREILSRFDDSVVRVIRAGSAGSAIQMIRRARGYAPSPITFSLADSKDLALAKGSIDSIDSRSALDSVIFAAGPEQKNTFTLMRLVQEGESASGKAASESSSLSAEAFVSQHIGDMENAEALDAWLTAKERMQLLFDLAPNLLACDLHPEYITAKWTCEQASINEMPLMKVQHHHAHIASVIAESGLSATEPVCGIAFDGTGYGVDGNIWGGEVLVANMGDFERFANFAYVPMPGGAAAIKHPLQMAYGVLWAFDLLDHPGAKLALETLGDAQCKLLNSMIEQGINTPVTSSVGRLFDAASALLGICTQPTYEGEPAIVLEAAMNIAEGRIEEGSTAEEHATEGDDDGEDDSRELPADLSLDLPSKFSSSSSSELSSDLGTSAYTIDIVKNTATANSTAHDTSVILFDAANLFRAMLDDVVAKMPVSLISRKFHDAFVRAILDAAQLTSAMYDIRTVALSGGVFMNRYIVENAIYSLEQAGFTVAINRELPPNDGCISFGEAVVCLFKD